MVPTVGTGPTAAAAAVAAREIGYPLVLKIMSPDISHKSDVGGVRLNLRDKNELRQAADDILARVRAVRPQARIGGFTVQTMATRPLVQELIIGASIDPVFGPVLLFGQGGTAVEVLADRAMAFIAVRTSPDGTAQTLGVVRAIIDPDNVDAEFAIIVRSDLKGQGLGRLLLRKMIDFLARRGAQRMVGYVLRENEAVRELAQSQGFVVDAVAAHADTLFLALPLAGGAYTASALS